jgi:hypothetical protein
VATAKGYALGLWSVATGTLSGIYNLVTNPAGTIQKTWQGLKFLLQHSDEVRSQIVRDFCTAWEGGPESQGNYLGKVVGNLSLFAYAGQSLPSLYRSVLNLPRAIFSAVRSFSLFAATLPGRQTAFASMVADALRWETISTSIADAAGAVRSWIARLFAGDAAKNVPEGAQPQTVFRGERSSRTPVKVFEEGIPAKGTNADLEAHVAANLKDSNFVATSIRPAIAKAFAGKNGYVYVIRTNNGIDVNATLGTKSPFPEQFEVAIPGGVANSEAMGAFPMKNGEIAGPFVPNPNYNPPK